MRIRVYAQTPSDFIAWVDHQKQIPPRPTDSLRIKGAIMFQKKACSSCHTIRGTPASGKIGPDLTHLASRVTILSGMLTNSKENLALWLKNPQKVKEGAHMPNFLLNQDEIDALSSYLWDLK
jgi:cytochrome c oxidase subunit 2